VKGPTEIEKADYKETLAVVSFLFKIDKKSHPFIIKMRAEDFGPISKISFSDLLPKESDQSKFKFFHYKGSLTNPPCADVVNWIVHSEVLPITESHLNSLRNVWHNKLGYYNYREC